MSHLDSESSFNTSIIKEQPPKKKRKTLEEEGSDSTQAGPSSVPNLHPPVQNPSAPSLQPPVQNPVTTSSGAASGFTHAHATTSGNQPVHAGQYSTTHNLYNAASSSVPPPKPQIHPQDRIVLGGTGPPRGSINPYLPPLPPLQQDDEINPAPPIAATQPPPQPTAEDLPTMSDPPRCERCNGVITPQTVERKVTFSRQVWGWLNNNIQPAVRNPAAAEQSQPQPESDDTEEGILHPPMKPGLRAEIRRWLDESVVAGLSPTSSVIESEDEPQEGDDERGLIGIREQGYRDNGLSKSVMRAWTSVQDLW
ncbi:hypothetical protein K440DRAFT_638113 [Wilcoxina mikolae CBS 423.85]|nr:hypothetical protein K440DRAFT_638113 [Wilcoxina mikolae CBS 423.85]